MDAFIFLVIALVVLGIIHYLIGKAPFLNEMFRNVLQWLVIVVGAVLLIDFLFGIAGHSFLHWH